MNPRFHVDLPLVSGLETALPAAAARHVQVLRLQPGAAITLFDGYGRDWPAEVLRMGRSEVWVRLSDPVDVPHELAWHITLAIGMPANERMDWLVEKATELGVAALQPLQCERSVLRLEGERAERKRAHWQAIAVAAAEQSGRAVVPQVQEVLRLSAWLASLPMTSGACWMLSLAGGSRPLHECLRACDTPAQARAVFLSGPEGGLSAAEEEIARSRGFASVSLGPRVLRADTAPLAALASLAALSAAAASLPPP